MIYVFLATGFEDVEALAPVDIMRRAGLQVETVSITGQQVVVSAHGVGVVTDRLIEDVDFSPAELLFLPGGLPGATNLDACEPLREALRRHAAEGKLIAAICAAPLVLGHLGLLDGKRATCYPGFETELGQAQYTAALIEEDGPYITGKGPGAAFALGYAIVRRLAGAKVAEQLREGMMYNFLLLHG